MGSIVIFEFALRKIPNDYSLKRDLLSKNSQEIEVLFLGNSHAYRGVNPKYISLKSFNAAYVSQSIDLDYDLMKKVMPKANKLKYIVIPISYSSLFGNLKSGKEKWRLKNYCIYYNICNSANISNYFEALSFKTKTNVNRLYNFYYKKINSVTSDDNGYGINIGTKELEKSGYNAAKRHTKKNFNLFWPNLKTIYKIISFAKENKLKVIFYTPPAYKSYRNHLNPKQLKLTFNTLNRISSNETSVYYKNYLSDTDFVTEDFYNADHLNNSGAKKLSLKLNNIITESRKQ